VPRSKALAHAMIAAAARIAPLVVVDGQKTDGVDSLWRDMRARVGDCGLGLTKAHGRLFWFRQPVRIRRLGRSAPTQGP
jgi:16S rRNA (guanine1207-N2)-methyltransferase